MGRPSIYGLYGADGSLIYIGKANVPARRLASHMRDARRRNTPLYAWIRKHGRPEVRVLEADCEDWKEAERRLIAKARADGIKLLNLADGGDEPFCSPETRSANGRRLVERIRTDARFRQLWTMKRQMAHGLSKGWVANKTRAKLRLLAELKPEIFGLWKNLPDREESPDGTPVVGYA